MQQHVAWPGSAPASQSPPRALKLNHRLLLLFAGLFLCTCLHSLVQETRRFVPEAVSFLTSTLSLGCASEVSRKLSCVKGSRVYLELKPRLLILFVLSLSPSVACAL